jgi:cytochrome c peroxidase
VVRPAVGPVGDPAFVWHLPAGFPAPRVPADNPMTAAKVALGRQLFYDERLSGDGHLSCAACHRQELAFTDGRARAVGRTGIEHPRSAMSLTNVAYNASLTWARPDLVRLEQQLAMPLFAVAPIEMGATPRGIEGRLERDPETVRRFRVAFPRQARPVRMENVAKALASFERTLVSGCSPYDRWVFWDEGEALDRLQRRGMELFFSRRAGCSGCHGGFNLSGPVVFSGSTDEDPTFHNTNLHNVDGKGSYPAADRGLIARSGRPEDMGRFRAPTLRNVARTAPYMHDGSLPTLEEVVEHYAAGGRARPVGPGRDPRLRAVALSAEDKRALVTFLEALTDEEFLTDPRFSDPEGEAPAGGDRESPRSCARIRSGRRALR